jgi:DNA-binding CsgD family transcriptional regulator
MLAGGDSGSTTGTMRLIVPGLRLRPAAAIIAAALMAAVIFGMRIADEDATRATLGLLVLPIGLVSMRIGWTAGLGAAGAAMALVAAWDVTQHVGLGPLGYVTRAAVYFGVVSLVLLQERPRPRHQRQTGRLLTKPPRVRSAPGASNSLSPRELEVLELLARGATNAQIAARFVIAEDTVKSHVKHILQKLGVGNRTEAALRYVELFGHPGRDGEALHAGAVDIGATSERGAEVARSPAPDRALLAVDDGATLDVPVLEPLHGRFATGQRAVVYFDAGGQPVGWYLPSVGLGVDMRAPGPRPG